MKGPNPVCTSARKKMNQSRPRWLSRDGVGGVSGLRASGPEDAAGSPPRPVVPPRWSSIVSGDGLDERTNSLLLQILRAEWLQAARGAEHHDRRILLIFGRCVHLILGQFERDGVALVGDAAEMQRVPVDDDLSAANAEKATEIDNGRANSSGAIDDHIDNVSHVLVGRAAYVTAEHAVCVPCPNDGDGGWRRGLLRRDRGSRIWLRLATARLRSLIRCPGSNRCESSKSDRNERKQRFCAHLSHPSTRGHERACERPRRPRNQRL